MESFLSKKKYSNVVGKHDSIVWSVAFSSDGKKIASGGLDKTIRLWDLSRSARGNELLDGTSKIIGRHDDSVYSVAFSPDGKKIVSGGKDKTVRLWDLARSARAKEPSVSSRCLSQYPSH